MLEKIKINNILFLDIETVSQYNQFSQVPDSFKELWDKKTAYLRKNEETAEEFYSRAGIWAEFGKIVCISVGMFKSETEFKLKTFVGDDEKMLLQDFLNLLKKLQSNIFLCAHNGKEFDFPYLNRRLIINNLAIPEILNVHGKKSWELNFLDTLELWKFGDYKHYTSLNLLATIFSIPSPKDEMDGSMVSTTYWNEKNLDKIAKYCQKDVVTTARIIQKFKRLELLKDENIEIV